MDTQKYHYTPLQWETHYGARSQAPAPNTTSIIKSHLIETGNLYHKQERLNDIRHLSTPRLLQSCDFAIEPELEPIAESPRIGVLILHHLKGVGDHLDVPHANGRAAAGLEA